MGDVRRDSSSSGEPEQETLEQFRLSFSYGTRNDLNFKFLKSTSDEDAAEFLRRLLDEVGNAYDTGDIDHLLNVAYEAQIRGYAVARDAAMVYDRDDGPFTNMKLPVTEARVGLLTSSGHFGDGDDPEPLGVANMSQAEAMDRIQEFLGDTPILSAIPSDIRRDELNVRHGGYDITSTEQDPNVTFPIDRLHDAVDSGHIKGVAKTYWSFPGATAHGRLRNALPMWLDRIHEEHVDAIVLVPV